MAVKRPLVSGNFTICRIESGDRGRGAGTGERRMAGIECIMGEGWGGGAYSLQQEVQALCICGGEIGLHVGSGGVRVRASATDGGAHQPDPVPQSLCESPRPVQVPAHVAWQERPTHRRVEPNVVFVPPACTATVNQTLPLSVSLSKALMALCHACICHATKYLQF